MNQCIDKEAYEWEFHANNWQCIINNLRPIFMLIDFDCHENDRHLLQGAHFIKSAFNSSKKLNSFKDNEFPQNLISKRLKPYIYHIKSAKKRIDPYKYEFFIYQQLMEHVKQGLVFCNDTLQYKSFEADLALKIKRKP